MSAPSYCTREAVKAVLDVAETARTNTQVDREIAAATEAVDGLLYRGRYGFSLTDATRYFPWPELDSGGSWRLYLEQNGLIALTTLVAGGVTIPTTSVYLEPINDGPPYTRLELVRNLNVSFGGGPTPQRQIAITGTWGYRDDREPAGTLVGAVNALTTAIVLSDSAAVGVGDLLICDNERMVVTGRAWVSTGSTLGGSGLTASNASTSLTGPTVAVGEQLLIDAETMLVVDVAGSTTVVRRAWDGSTLASHANGATIYADRGYVVARGTQGTAAASHADAATVEVHRPPALIRDLAIAEAITTLLQAQAGYARTIRVSAEAAKEVIGHGLQDLRDRATARYGRNVKIGAA